MKLRIITFAFVACLASSFVFADNPTDAPLMPSDENTTVAQQENQPSHKPKRSRKKDTSMYTSAKAKSDNSMKDNGQKQQSDPEYPATNDNSPAPTNRSECVFTEMRKGRPQAAFDIYENSLTK